MTLVALFLVEKAYKKRGIENAHKKKNKKHVKKA